MSSVGVTSNPAPNVTRFEKAGYPTWKPMDNLPEASGTGGGLVGSAFFGMSAWEKPKPRTQLGNCSLLNLQPTTMAMLKDTPRDAGTVPGGIGKLMPKPRPARTAQSGWGPHSFADSTMELVFDEVSNCCKATPKLGSFKPALFRKAMSVSTTFVISCTMVIATLEAHKIVPMKYSMAITIGCGKQNSMTLRSMKGVGAPQMPTFWTQVFRLFTVFWKAVGAFWNEEKMDTMALITERNLAGTCDNMLLNKLFDIFDIIKLAALRRRTGIISLFRFERRAETQTILLICLHLGVPLMGGARIKTKSLGFVGSERLRAAGRPFKKMGGETTHLIEGFFGRPEPPRPELNLGVPISETPM
jgi:hypothetical protein